jgi:hypothetical protein
VLPGAVSQSAVSTSIVIGGAMSPFGDTPHDRQHFLATMLTGRSFGATNIRTVILEFATSN